METGDDDVKGITDVGEVGEVGDIISHLDEEEFRSSLKAVLKIKEATMETINKDAHRNIKTAQKKQKKYYDRRHNTSNREQLQVGDEVLFYENRKNQFRKGGKENLPYSLPYQIVEIDNRNRCTLKNVKSGVILKSKQALSNLKKFRKRKAELLSDDEGDTSSSDLSERENRPKKITRRLLGIK